MQFEYYSVNRLYVYMITRRIKEELAALLDTFPAVALLSPRQVGKTALTRELLKGNFEDVVYFDLATVCGLEGFLKDILSEL
jgi:predicted AAA+ superfamily ATPase